MIYKYYNLKQKNFSQAAISFERAFWLDGSSFRARAGIIAVKAAQGIFSPEDEKWLREILEQDKTDSHFYDDFFRKIEDKTRDNYIRGLLAYHFADYSNAESWFRKVGNPAEYP